MADLSINDQAQILAESLDIDQGSFKGREADAVVAMTLIKGSRKIPETQRRDVLRIIGEDMGFGQSNPAFVQQCRLAVADILVEPAWRPGSLTNDELVSEIRFWQDVSNVLAKLGFTSAGAVGIDRLRSAGKAISSGAAARGGSSLGEMVADARKGAGSITGPLMFGTAAKSIADASTSDLEAEAKRRGVSHELSALDATKYGGS